MVDRTRRAGWLYALILSAILTQDPPWVAAAEDESAPAARPVMNMDELDGLMNLPLKVAYLRYIAEYTTWPPSQPAAPDGPFNFCVLGHDVEGMTARIDELIVESGRRIQSRPVHLEILSRGFLPFIPGGAALTESIHQCHLLYVFPSEKERWEDLSRHLKNEPVVTVSDMKGFSKAGGMIEFVLKPDPKGTGLRYSLHINLENCRRAGLRLSAKLLNLKQAVTLVETP